MSLICTLRRDQALAVGVSDTDSVTPGVTVLTYARGVPEEELMVGLMWLVLVAVGAWSFNRME